MKIWKRVPDTSLAEPSTKLSGSIVAAIVVCVLIGFLAIVVVVIIVVVLLRRRRQRQKDAELAAQKIVGPSTKPAQPTHNGTWSSGTFRGLWKDQTWRNAMEDELPLSDRPDGQRSASPRPLSRDPSIGGGWHWPPIVIPMGDFALVHPGASIPQRRWSKFPPSNSKCCSSPHCWCRSPLPLTGSEISSVEVFELFIIYIYIYPQCLLNDL